MMYIALLRGINVGGNNKVDMVRLKKVFENLKFTNVAAYINSGNIIFETDQEEHQLEKMIEKKVEKGFGFRVPVIVRNKTYINNLLIKVPSNWTNDGEQKTDVMFLWKQIDDQKIKTKVDYKPEIEKIIFTQGAIIWNINRQNALKGSGIKLIKTETYKFMTVRNINTVRKLNKLMN